MIWNNSINWWFKFIRQSKTHSNWINIKSYVLIRIFMSRRRSLAELSWYSCNSNSSFNIYREGISPLSYYKLLRIFIWSLSINRSAFENMFLVICLVQILIISCSISLMKKVYHSRSTTKIKIGYLIHFYICAIISKSKILIFIIQLIKKINLISIN